jgi:DNA-binding NarL/FixJ family response regulator
MGTEPQVTALSSASERRVGLITGVADDELVTEICAILAREGFPPIVFDRVGAAVAAREELAAIVVWLEDAVSSVVDVVEPLKHRFELAALVLACPEIERWEVRAALAAGASGVVVRTDLDSGLGPCLRAVQAGQVCVPQEHWREVEPRALSGREKEVLGLVVMGYMNSQIAKRLFLAESTVKSHLSSAFGKLGVRSRNEAAELIASGRAGVGIGMPAPLVERLARGSE